MVLNYLQLRKIFADFWENKDHQKIPPASLVLKEDPTTLFTSSGMQQLVPYLLGERYPLGKKLYDIQPCLRTQDIMEVGDMCHTTFFEMMGNWSLGDYFKKEQLAWVLGLFTKHFNLPKEKLYVTVFEGTKEVPKDEESALIWKKLGIPNERIFYYGVDKNWWSRSGTPDQMPASEIGGPDSEVFYDFGLPHNEKFGEKCHPNCQCGRFLEIGNSVFIQYQKMADGSLKELSQKNVDFGGGVERILAASSNEPDVFSTELFSKIIKKIEEISQKSYSVMENKPPMRVIADHLKASTFLMVNGTIPSNKEHGSILRRLIRRSVVKMRQLTGRLTSSQDFVDICREVMATYGNIYFDVDKDILTLKPILEGEVERFKKSLEKGLQIVHKIEKIDGRTAFDLYQSYGFPLEITEELLREKGQVINREQFYQEFNKHRQLSRTASAGMFKGGLADQSEKTIKYHTATHLIHQALFDVLGHDIRQEGSNINPVRLRFDFYSLKKPSGEDLKKVETVVNEKIREGLTVSSKIMPKEEASKLGAKAFFRQKYPDMVTVYMIDNYSKELCGGPHVKNTKEIGPITFYKMETIGANLYRLYAK